MPVWERRIISGKLEFYDNIPQIVHPHHVKKINDEKAFFDKLEKLITENDMIDKKPIRSAVIVSKINKMNGNNIPHEDFFLFLSKNKIYNGEKNIKSYTQFHKKLIRELFS